MYRVEVYYGLRWHLDSEHKTKLQASRRHRDLCSASYDPIRVLTPSGKVCQESKIVEGGAQ